MVALGRLGIPEPHVRLGIVRAQAQGALVTLDRLVVQASRARHEQVAERLEWLGQVGINLTRRPELRRRLPAVPQREVDLPQVIVREGERRVDLHRPRQQLRRPLVALL